MTSYNVLITSDDPAKPRISLRFDDGGGSPVLRELTLQADGSNGLVAGDLPVLDLNQIVRAVTAALLPTPPTAPQAAPADVAADLPAPDKQREVRPSVPRPRRAGRPVRDNADSATAATPRVAAKAAKTAAKSTTAKSATPKKDTTAKKAPMRKATGTAAGGGTGRVYRRVPDDFAEVINQTGDNAAAIADHYRVPKHTAYGWIRSHRKHAVAPARP